jgi:hypothetical protein
MQEETILRNKAHKRTIEHFQNKVRFRVDVPHQQSILNRMLCLHSRHFFMRDERNLGLQKAESLLFPSKALASYQGNGT